MVPFRVHADALLRFLSTHRGSTVKRKAGCRQDGSLVLVRLGRDDDRPPSIGTAKHRGLARLSGGNSR